VSSLVSVFDDFGSAVFVPEGGFVLNNRAEGFGAPPNDLRSAALPVHTLAPAMRIDPDGEAIAMATPGADGQVQTLLQVLLALRYGGADLPTAIAAPRWRGEGSSLLIEEGHPGRAALEAHGHRLETRPFGDPEFGALVVAGVARGAPWAAGDHRREVASGAV
jgi:gamma-glutamyltranspeptidase/glutathione hydrolase